MVNVCPNRTLRPWPGLLQNNNCISSMSGVCQEMDKVSFLALKQNIVKFLKDADNSYWVCGANFFLIKTKFLSPKLS